LPSPRILTWCGSRTQHRPSHLVTSKSRGHEAGLQKRRIVVFDAGTIADDWIAMTQEAELKLLADRLKAAGKGIIPLHDPEAQTAAVLPAFLRYLRDNGRSVVHVVSGAESRPVADVEQSEKRE
jgi:hypothetical protein